MKRSAGKWPLRQRCHPAACIFRTASACPERSRRIQLAHVCAFICALHEASQTLRQAQGRAAHGPEEKAANSWVRGSRSISVSEQRAPGLAAVRIGRGNSIGIIETDSAHSLCPHSRHGLRDRERLLRRRARGASRYTASPSHRQAGQSARSGTPGLAITGRPNCQHRR